MISARPVNSHQNCIVASGSAPHTVRSKAVAYDGDRTSCGATHMSSVPTFSRK
ncbi:PAAR domain-containing protein [Duganella sp. 1411]|uniref:PAAR domain-containing protein n=1 Tax=Duganella sp. 1411 TaxID=2806572 RepID=UPI0035A5B161